MLKLNAARENVMSIVFNSYDKLLAKGYYQYNDLLILLALYSYKTKEYTEIKREILDSVIHIVGEDSEAFVEIVDQLRKVDHNDYLEIYTSVIDEVVERIFFSNARPANGQFVLPNSLVTLLCDLMKIYNVSSVYNPYAGIPFIPLSIENIPCYAQEVDMRIHAIGMIMLDAHGYDTSRISLSDAFEEWNPSRCECVVSFPPFGRTILRGNDETFPIKTIEEFVFWKFTRSTERYAIYIVPTGFCFNSSASTEKVRKELIENNYLDMVISLPTGIFVNMGINTSIVVLKKERDSEEPVKFYDAREKYIAKNKREKAVDVEAVLSLIKHSNPKACALISRDDIRDNDYKWDVERYISRKLEVFPDGYQVVELKDIVESISGNRHFNDKEGRLVRIALMSGDPENYYRAPDSFELSSDIQKCSKLEEPALLLSTIGVLKPTICSASAENPVFLHPHVKAFRIKAQWVNPAYLCLQLSKSKGFAIGAFVPHINLRDILKIRVAFPSLETQQSFDEQGRLFHESIESSKIAKAKELGLHEVINKMKSEYMIEVRNRKHDMKTPMASLRNTLTLIDALARELPEEQSLKLKTYINRQRTAIDTLSEIVRHLADEENFSEPEVLELETILSSFAEINDKYRVVYVPDRMALNVAVGKEKAKIYIGKSDLLRLINNIIGNAVNHGFVENKPDYEVLITLSVDGDFYMIDFINNGKPLPDGMDKDHYGMKGVKGRDSKGNGIGGSIVKGITEHYGGDFDIFTREDHGKLLTDVIVKLPIYKGDE